MLEAKLIELIETYCITRNTLTKKVDLLRELRGDAEDCFVNTKTNSGN